MGRYPLMQFSTKINDKPEDAAPKEKKTRAPRKKVEASTTDAPVTPKKRGTKEAKPVEDKKATETKKPEVFKLYTLKFNSPILPFAKFPLTQNKYIQDFLRKYEEDKEQVTRIIGVHFPDNNNSLA